MNKQAIYHRPKQNWAYAYDLNTIHLRVRTGRDDISNVQAIWGDKYVWDKTVTISAMTRFASDELFDYWEIAIKPPYNRLRYGFQFSSEHETLYLTDRGFQNKLSEYCLELFEFPFINPGDVFQPPAWVKDAVFYEIFPERFANGDPAINPENTEPWGGNPTPTNFFGGDLQGIIDHLDYVESLGVNALYLTPIFESPSNHKYNTTNYMKVDPHFGSTELLKELVSKCHKKGIRVVLDAVFNHCGNTFAPFLDVTQKGKESRYAEWFRIREFPLRIETGIPTYETFSFEPLMPKLNTGNPELKQYLLDVARYWLEETGIDGWRLDVANEVDHRFWREMRDVVKRTNPDAYLFGEIMHDAMPWLKGDQFDAVMNYPLADAILDFTARNVRDAKQFADRIGSLLAAYPQHVNEVMYTLLDSHDTVRALTQCNDDKRRLKLASVFQFTFFGVPSIYYGDEIGINGEYDPGSRKCMVWDEQKQDRDLFDFFTSLIKLRLKHTALRGGSFEVLTAEPGQYTMAYARESDGERFIVAMNADDDHAKLTLPLPETYRGEGALLLGNGKVAWENLQLHVSLPPCGFVIVQLHRSNILI